MSTRLIAPILLAAAAGCGTPRAQDAPPATAIERTSREVPVRDTVLAATLDAGGVAAPVERATLSTHLMATVADVLVHEGDRVVRGQPLLRLDARELDARRQQAAAALAEAEAVHADAARQAARMRALFADSAAPRAMLDAAETGLARASAGVAAARAGATAVAAVRDDAEIRAPFEGVVTRRWVDRGAMAAPGAPLLAIEDAGRLRVTAAITAEAARGLRAGMPVDATVEGRLVRAVVEGVVPAAAGGIYTVNALVPNADRRLLSGGAASLRIPLGRRAALVVPAAALIEDGDLVGVRVRSGRGDALRWIKPGRRDGGMAEVLAGLQPGDRVLVPRIGGA
ncbi:MAG: efflux RND transporter periplasmic adaptor subunit [Gemmatimonadetes bacterium]|nr:efflux RND transporter periplasmic adaptor subunit [Gemmatimonadota bacterium]